MDWRAWRLSPCACSWSNCHEERAPPDFHMPPNRGYRFGSQSTLSYRWQLFSSASSICGPGQPSSYYIYLLQGPSEARGGCAPCQGVSKYARPYIATEIHWEAFFGGFVSVEDGFQMIFGWPWGGGQVFGEIRFGAVSDGRPFVLEGRLMLVDVIAAGIMRNRTRRLAF